MSKLCTCCGGFCKEFKQFVLRGSIIDLAIGIIIGGAFTKVVESLVNDIITPPFGFLIGGVDFVNLTIQINNFYANSTPVVIRYGRFIQALIYLVLVAFVIFLLMKLINKLHNLAKKNKQEKGEIQVTEEVKVLREIRDILAENGKLTNAEHIDIRKQISTTYLTPIERIH
ncbi:unnamed protein product [Didymodactylos carnosus]|uniref:Large-conductance mechanosensitive channel n=1 Tax=Didymodactylos carnosus TaxID=1234261 RepID=A0A815X8Y9_9BILA|nr:unnamed protein product [Didymodactylos carnosus]CAF1554484.1 unnamed protein product [Didymodactylos carnosus]CAF4269601.1 unnamed protein product [Didymodactylos carnosus]CAF4415658.1 unnamed protein product [Didymodactylos carnosus]